MDSQVDLNGSDTVREILKKKHPPGKPIVPSIIIPLEVPIKAHHPVIFEDLNGTFIRSTALRTSGAAGLSGMDSSAWRRMCSSFHNASSELCTGPWLVNVYAPHILTPWTSEHLWLPG